MRTARPRDVVTLARGADNCFHEARDAITQAQHSFLFIHDLPDLLHQRQDFPRYRF